jgi:hypothetical protein
MWDASGAPLLAGLPPCGVVTGTEKPGHTVGRMGGDFRPRFADLDVNLQRAIAVGGVSDQVMQDVEGGALRRPKAFRYHVHVDAVRNSFS